MRSVPLKVAELERSNLKKERFSCLGPNVGIRILGNTSCRERMTGLPVPALGVVLSECGFEAASSINAKTTFSSLGNLARSKLDAGTETGNRGWIFPMLSPVKWRRKRVSGHTACARVRTSVTGASQSSRFAQNNRSAIAVPLIIFGARHGFCRGYWLRSFGYMLRFVVSAAAANMMLVDVIPMCPSHRRA